MRIDALHLHAFGPFTDRTLDFRSGNFQLVYGHNEAGKSSMLRAIEAGLFGIPTRTQDNFLHDNRDLRIGLELSNKEGSKIQFKRRKGNKGTLLSLRGEEAKLPDNLLDAFLRGIERERFLDIHCINHEAFRAGGQTMLDLKGLAGDTLLAASNTKRFLELQRTLKAELEELYGARKGRLRDIKKAYEEAKQKRKESEVSARDWTQLQEQQENLQQRHHEIRERIKTHETERGRLDRLRTALPKITTLKIKQQELETQRECLVDLLGNSALTSLPKDYSVDARRNCEANIVSSKRSIDELELQLRDLASDLAKIQESPDLIKLGGEIDSLQQRLETQRSGVEERQQLSSELELADREVKRLLHELGLQIPVDKIPDHRIRRDCKREIMDLVSNERSIAERMESYEKQHRQLQHDLAANRRQQEQLGDVIDVSMLELHRKEVERHDGIETQIAEKRGELADRLENAERLLARMPYWNGSLDEVDRVPLPLAETIDRFDAEFADLEHEQQSIDEAIELRRTELKKIQQKVAAEKQTTGVVTEAELMQIRKRRDHGWSLVRQAWLKVEDAAAIREFAAELPLDQAYEQSVGESDDVADRLRRESDRLTKLAMLEGQLADYLKEIERFEEARQELQRQHQGKIELWQSEWATTGIGAARPPKDMRGWLNKWSKLRDAAREVLVIRRECERLEAVRDEAMNKLHKAFAACEIQCADDSLTAILIRATQAVKKQQELASEQVRLRAEQARLEAELETVVAEMKLVEERRGVWRQSWAVAMRQINCDPETSTARAQTLIEGLEDLTQKYDELLNRKSRIDSIDESAVRFVQDVSTTARRSMDLRLADMDVSDTETAVDVARQLLESFRLAQQNEQRATTVRAAQRKLEGRLVDYRAERGSHERALTEFVKAAGVESPEQLAPLEAFSLLQRECESLVDEIRIMGGGIEFEEFVGRAEGYDDAGLAAEIGDLELQLQQEREAEHEIVVALSDVQKRIDVIDGNNRVPLADQQMVNCLSEAQDVANRCSRLMIAQHILRQQVERYRESNRDPLLAKASAYFSAMACGEFTGLDIEDDEQGEAVIVGKRRSIEGHRPEKVEVERMSDGTRDPVFLALRLAYLQRRASQHEAMPLIVDDLLIHLDDDRALATLQVLADISSEMQVLFFTHHDRIRQLAQSNLPSDILTVHELHRRGSPDVMSAST